MKNYSKNIKYNTIIKNLISINKECHYTLNDRILKNFLIINKKQSIDLISCSQKIADQLNYNKIDNLQLILGKNNFQKFLFNLKNNLEYASNNINSYYFDLLEKRIELTKFITSTMENNKVLDIPVYDHITHKTGRVKIKKGFNFLVCKKNQKENFKPSEGNLLVEIDFKAAEPSLLYNVIYDKQVKDVYNMFNLNHDRKKIKLAVISSLYGGTKNKIKKLTGLCYKDIESIKSQLNVTELKEYLSNQVKEKGYIQNLYGRHIYGENNLINYWLQSSTADYAMSCFYSFFKNYKVDIKAIIHDAILFECTQKQYSKIKNINYLTDPVTNISLFIDKKIISK